MATAFGSYATAAALKTRLGISDTTDDTLLGTICDQVNSYIEGPEGAGRPLAPVTSAIYLLDGNGMTWLHYPRGIRAITLLEVAQETGGTFTTLDAGDYFVRPLAQDRYYGHPGTRIELSDRPVSGFARFPVGYSNVRVTMTTGFDAIPDEITEAALTIATRMWHGRQSGQSDVVGTDDTGAPVVSRFISQQHRYLLKQYRPLLLPL